MDIAKLVCKNAMNTLNKVYSKKYGLGCNEKTLTKHEYIENLMYADIIKSGIKCKKTKCNG